jgi:C-terminal processing protease CtpA/Prc
VLPGDIIAAIDGATVPNSDGFSRMIGERKGKAITVTLVRQGQRTDKTVQLNR